MPVPGEPGLISKLAGGSENLREREPGPVAAYRTARPGPSFIPGPPLALANSLAWRVGRPGRTIQRRTAMSALPVHRHFVTAPTSAIVGARRDLLSRSGQEILT